MPVTQSRPSEAPGKRERRQPLPKRIWDSLVHPIIRLPVEFPWGLKQFSKLYLMAVVFYLVGSLVPMMLIFGATTLAIQVWPEAMTALALNGEGQPTMQYTLVVTIIF